MTLDLMIDAEIVDLTEDEATEITGRIRAWVKAFPVEDVKRAYLGRIWSAMGYDSWAEWCDCELDGFKLPAVERREVVSDLAQSGMSNRAIANVVGVGKSTICRDRRELPTVPNGTVTGKDGREIDTSNIGKLRRSNSTLQTRALKGAQPQLSGIATALEAAFTGTFDKGCTPDIAHHAAQEMRASIGRINKVVRMLEEHRLAAPVLSPTDAEKIAPLGS